MAPEPDIALPSREERRRILKLARRLTRISFRDEAERYVSEAQLLWHWMPERYLRAVAYFKRFGSSRGGLYVAGLPIGPVPRTPQFANVAVDLTPIGAAVLSLFAAGLGDQFGFAPELSGLILQAIVPMKGAEDTQRSVSSRVQLYRHVETAFTRYRADYVGLFCLRADHDGIAGTTLASIEAILPRLAPSTIAILRQRRFETTVDESFLIGSNRTSPIVIADVSVLTGLPNRPRLRVDFAETTGTDADAQAALDELVAVALEVESTVRLAAGDILFIDNNHALHGRTDFTPQWDGHDRWLMRTFVTRDLSASAEVRPGNGRIVHIDFSADPDAGSQH